MSLYYDPMINTETKTNRITYRKGENFGFDGRWYVYLDDTKIGWVSKGLYKEYEFYSPVEKSGIGKLIGVGHTRNDATEDALGTLRIYHLGRVMQYNDETGQDYPVYFDTDDLHQLEQDLAR